MSIETMAMVLHHSRAKGTAKLVLLGIANHDGDGGAWPSIATLATYANVHERNVQRSIDQLVSKGELVVHPNDGGTRDTPDRFRPNRYTVLVRCPSYCDRSAQHRDTRRVSGRQLWFHGLSTGVSRTTPHLPTGVSHPTPPGVSLATPEPPTQPTSPVVVPQPQDTRTCVECSQPEAVCRRAQAKLRADDRHDYLPVPRR